MLPQLLVPLKQLPGAFLHAIRFALLVLILMEQPAFSQCDPSDPGSDNPGNVVHYAWYSLSNTKSEVINCQEGCIIDYPDFGSATALGATLKVMEYEGTNQVFLYISERHYSSFGGTDGACSPLGYSTPSGTDEWERELFGRVSLPLNQNLPPQLNYLVRATDLEDLKALVQARNYIQTGYCSDGSVASSMVTNVSIAFYFTSAQINELLQQGEGAELPLSNDNIPDCLCSGTYTTKCRRPIACPDGTNRCYEYYDCQRSLCDPLSPDGNEPENDCQTATTITIQQPPKPE